MGRFLFALDTELAFVQLFLEGGGPRRVQQVVFYEGKNRLMPLWRIPASARKLAHEMGTPPLVLAGGEPLPDFPKGPLDECVYCGKLSLIPGVVNAYSLPTYQPGGVVCGQCGKAIVRA